MRIVIELLEAMSNEPKGVKDDQRGKLDIVSSIDIDVNVNNTNLKLFQQGQPVRERIGIGPGH
jgi:hypothetical protein